MRGIFSRSEVVYVTTVSLKNLCVCAFVLHGHTTANYYGSVGVCVRERESPAEKQAAK
jgi:hypothetical protein